MKISPAQWNGMINQARAASVKMGPGSTRGGGRAEHPWKVEVAAWEENDNYLRIDVAPAAVNGLPFCVPYKVNNDLRKREVPLVAAIEGDRTVDVPCYDADPPYILASVPPYAKGEQVIFIPVPNLTRPPFFKQSPWNGYNLWRTSVQVSMTTKGDIVPFFIGVTPPTLANFRVFVGPTRNGTALARGGSWVVLANVYLARPMNALVSDKGDEIFVDQRVFYSLGVSITPPAETELPTSVLDALAGIGVSVNSFLDSVFEEGETVAIWTQ
jgi:hypothetical protein